MHHLIARSRWLFNLVLLRWYTAIYKLWEFSMRIDLHAHTQKCKTGDGSHRAIKPDDFIVKLAEQDVKVCSITNHNKFDTAEFLAIKDSGSDLLIFPGIELDIDFDGERRHIVVIANPANYQKFYDVFDNEPGRNLNTFFLLFEDFVDRVKKFKPEEIIIIPHFMDKDRGFTVEEKKELFTSLAGYLVILETSKLRSMGFVNAHEGQLALIGSDVKDWRAYSGDLLPELKFRIDSFEKFYELACDTKSFVKNALNGAAQNSIAIKNTSGKIEIFNDVNILFGEKGSGKTMLLKDTLLPYFSNEGKKVILHEGKDYAKLYNEMIEKYEAEVLVDQQNLEDTISNFDAIIQFNEQNSPDFIKSYIAYRRDDTKNKNSKRIIKSDATFSNDDSSDVDSNISRVEGYVASIDKVKAINRLTRADEKNTNRITLNANLNELVDEIKARLTVSYKNSFISSHTETFLEALKDSLRKNSGKESKPTNVGFSKLVARRLQRVEQNYDLLNALNSLQKTSTQRIGSLPSKGDVEYETSIVVLTKEDKHKKDSVFDKSKIVRNRELIIKLHNFDLNVFPNINEYFDSVEKDITGSIFSNDVIKKNSVIKIAGNDDYKPSEGEQAILSISGLLEAYDYDCYLFDEVERGLGNKYISEYLIPRLKVLRDKGKTLVVSTHNANIAINTLPSQVVFCNYPDDNTYYKGNMYSNELVGVVDGAVLSWEEQALIHLEGSEEMFNRRRNIYGI